MAIAGLVLGILAFLLSFVPVFDLLTALPLGVIGLVLALFGIRRAKKLHTGKGLAVTGLVLNVLALIITIVVSLLLAVAVQSTEGNTLEEKLQNMLDNLEEQNQTELPGPAMDRPGDRPNFPDVSPSDLPDFSN